MRQLLAHTPWRLLRPLVALATLLLGHTAQAQFAEPCLTKPVALPGLSGPPVWFDPGSSVTWRAELNDPRWAGAPLYSLCSDTDLTNCAAGGPNAQFRVLLDGTTLYIAVHNMADDDGGDASDAVYVGIGYKNPNNAARAVRIAIEGTPITAPGAPIVSGPTLPSPAPDTAVATWTSTDASTNGATWSSESTAFDTIPGWLPGIGGNPGIAVWRNPGAMEIAEWGVTLKVDLTQFDYALPVNEKIRIFVGSAHTNSMSGNATVPDYTAGNKIDDDVIPVDWHTWSEFDPAGTCSGVTINSSQIGVWNGSALTNEIQGCPPAEPMGGWPTGCPDATNEFRAIPQNVPNSHSADAVPHSVRATFRLANWGTTTDSVKHAPFQPIPGLGDPLNTPSPGDLPSGWDWEGNTTGNPAIKFTCSVNTGAGHNYCPVISNAASKPHQCMLVQLGEQPGSNDLKFTNSAVYRNMNFQNLSTVSRLAEINVKGLQALTGKAVPRDVYLYVQKKNMPPPGDEAMQLPRRTMQLLKQYAEQPPPLPRPDPQLKGRGVATHLANIKQYRPLPTHFIHHDAIKDPSLNPLVLPTMSDQQALELAWPTYKVFAYYDTGRKKVVNGVERMVLGTMVPFGMYLDHEGAFYGFTETLVGTAGAQLVQIAPNWYKVVVPNEGVATIKAVVSAEEKPKSQFGCPNCCCDKQPPPVKVIVKPRCYCSAPGVDSQGGLALFGGMGLLALGATVRIRWRRRKG